jgi:hypothetical protein
VTAIDTNDNVSAHIQLLKSRGVTAVGRYYSSSGWKRITRQEAIDISKAGMDVFVVFEDDGDPVLTSDTGTHHAQIAANQARGIGQPEGSAIYFALEHLPDGYKKRHVKAIKDYIGGIRDGLGGKYKVGVYSDGVVCDALLAAGLCEYTWLSASSSFEGSKEFYQSGKWSLAQDSHVDQKWNGLSVDVNEAKLDFGAFQVPVEAETSVVEGAAGTVDGAPGGGATAGWPLFMVAAQRANLEDLVKAKAAMTDMFLRPTASGFRALAVARSPDPRNNVVGVAVAEKETDGTPTGVMGVKFLVRRKYVKDAISYDHRLPETINGLPVDVEEVGDIRALVTFPDPRTTITPVQPGCSIGFQMSDPSTVMAGTLGAIVKDQNGGQLGLLSNNHVMADQDRLPIGAPIFQAGLLDLPAGGTRRQIARLLRFIPLSQSPRTVDAAFAVADDPQLLTPAVLFIGAPQGTADAAVNDEVHKFGRTTSYRVGSIKSISADVTVGYETGDYLFENQILIVGKAGSSFSDAGDSGSLILERQGNRAVGLLFAGSPTHTIANHIGDVLAALQVQLV